MMYDDGPIWLRRGGQHAMDAKISRENRARIAPKRKHTQRNADEEKTRENRNMSEKQHYEKPKAEHDFSTGPVWLREGGQHAPDARNLREDMARIARGLQDAQREGAHGKTPENRNVREMRASEKAQAELEDFFQDAAAGVKFDAGKLRMDLLPPEAENAMAQILTDGADKYGERNWEHGMAWSRPYAALRRHLIAWWSGEDADPESGHSHLWHVLTNAAFLVAYEQRGIGRDDRP